MASRVTSKKWISTVSEEESGSRPSSHADGRLILNDVRSLFQPTWNSHTNLISIFGRARQGKSFLMNCLSGEQNVFKVSNYKESCTQGIDVSSKFMPLADFARVDGGSPTESSANIRVGFVDAEGQGDKDVSYDANLICPILLASKCVIFNWKGDLQKDHILSTLGIMTRAAKNVSTDDSAGSHHSSGTGKKKFGHLHIVFRDWQAVDSDATSTFHTLFSPETSKDAQTRNQIREEVRDAFESIQVWLFDAPTDSVQALRQVLTIDMTTPRFRHQVREFRAVLSRQLQQPVFFAGHALTGKGIYSMMKDIVQTLNRGGVILPSSTYLTMMKEEVGQLTQDFERTVKATIEESLQEIEQRKRHVVKVPNATGGSGTLHLYLNTADAISEYRQRVDKLRLQSLHQIQEVIGLSAPPVPGIKGKATPYEQLYLETATRFQRSIEEEGLQSFLMQYQQQFLQYLRLTRQRLEGDMEKKAQALQRSTSLEMPPSDYRNYITAVVLEQSLSELNYQNYYTTGPAQASEMVIKEIADVEGLLRRFAQPLCEQCVASYEQLFAKRKVEMEEIFGEACRKMDATIPLLFQRLLQQHPRGFPLTVFASALDAEYRQLNSLLRQQIEALFGTAPTPGPVLKEWETLFFKHCESLRETCEKDLAAIKEQQFTLQFQLAEDQLNQELRIGVDGWEKEAALFITTLEEDPESAVNQPLLTSQEIENTFEQILTRLWKQAIANVMGWLSETVPKERLADDQFLMQTTFGRKLYDFLRSQVQASLHEVLKVFGVIEQKRQIALFKLQEDKEKAAAAAAALAAQMEAEEEGYDEDDYHDNQTVQMEQDYDDLDLGDDRRVAGQVFDRMKQQSKMTVAEQRRRAREFAERVLGVDFAGKSKGSKKKSSAKSTSSGTKSSSVAQQREAAKQYAARTFGAQVLEADEEEEEEDARLKGGAKTSKRSHDDFTAEKSETTPVKGSSSGVASSSATKRSAKKADQEDAVAAARKAAMEAQAQREREIIERATKRIEQRKGRK